ncbi:MAG: glycosyltransferase [Actinomycetales bacterium]|nr:glycosyltransferase [Actinomycetales bacterium]
MIGRARRERRLRETLLDRVGQVCLLPQDPGWQEFTAALGEEGSLSLQIHRLLQGDPSDVDRRMLCLALLAAGRYPQAREEEALIREARLVACGAGETTALLRRLAGMHDARRRLETIAAPLADVTSVLADPNLSGIPRVARMFAEIDTVVPVVWTHAGGLVPVALRDGAFTFPEGYWRLPNPVARAVFRSMQGVASLIKRSVTTQGLLSFLHAIPGLRWLYLRLRGNGQPTARVCVVPSHASFLETEVCREDTVHRLQQMRRHGMLDRLLVMVHDVLPLTRPEYFSHDEVTTYARFGSLLSETDVVIAASQAVATDVRAYCALRQWEEPLIVVDPLPSDFGAMATSTVELPAPARYLVVMGGIDRRKNNGIVLRAAARALSDDAGLGLVMVIGSVRDDPQLVDEIRAVAKAGTYIDVRFRPSDAELEGLIRASRGVVYMSLAEGYGLPVIEALSVGRPVILSNVPPLTEFLPLGGCVAVDPRDELALAEALTRVLVDDAFHDELTRGIDVSRTRARREDWQQRQAALLIAQPREAMGAVVQ